MVLRQNNSTHWKTKEKQMKPKMPKRRWKPKEKIKTMKNNEEPKKTNEKNN